MTYILLNSGDHSRELPSVEKVQAVIDQHDLGWKIGESAHNHTMLNLQVPKGGIPRRVKQRVLEDLEKL